MAVKPYKSVCPKIDPEILAELAREYRTANKGASRAIHSWMAIKTSTMADVRDFLTGQEMEAVRMAHTGLKFDPVAAIVPANLVTTMADAELAFIESVEELTKFIGQLEQLTPAECFFLVEWATDGRLK